jgi:hypothetical protein
MAQCCRFLRWHAGAVAALLLGLSACGGGGGGTTTSPVTHVLPPVSAANAVDANVAVLEVKQGPQSNVNIPYVSVTVCVPGSTSNCQTIDQVLVDTGSTGLRLFASQVSLSLPAHQIGNNAGITSCAQFVNTLAWGSITRADVAISGERASNIPIQLMDASNYPSAFSTPCGSSPLIATSSDGVKNWRALSANGILGVGQFASDGQTYFKCTGPNAATCQLSGSNAPSAAQQVRNPVSHFATNNNGVVLQLPAVPDGGATQASGYLIFGINTQGNNQLLNANLLQVNNSGQFTTVYNGAELTRSLMDSGANGLYFNDKAISNACLTVPTDFYCPSSTRNLTATIRLGGTSATVPITFSIANADTLTASGNYVFNNLGGKNSESDFDPAFVWGLPFFFGRSVFTAIEGKQVTRTSDVLTGPFSAFTN